MAKNYFGITDTGKRSEINEDTFIAEKVLDNRFIIACVIDGVGGYEGGEVAAKIARQTILTFFKTSSGEVSAMVTEALLVADKNIHEEKVRNEVNKDMACVLTLALVDLQSNQFYYAHVGDTRLYLLRDNSLVKVTKDHSFVGFLEDSGRLTEEEAMKHPKRHIINKALGFDAQIGIDKDYIETGVSPFLPGDTLLVCSDGLTDMINSNKIISVLKKNQPLSGKSKELIDEANNAGGKDNITVVLVENNSKPINLKATKPVSASKNKDVLKQQALPVQQEDLSPEPVADQKPANKSVIPLLSVLCLLLLIGLLWVSFRKPQKQILIQNQIQREPNSQEKKLSDTTARMTGHTLYLTDSLFNQPFFLSRPLLIQNDTLHLRGAGNTLLTADSAFSGPAIMLSNDCKFVLLEDLTLKDFDIGVLVQNKKIGLKNVKFINCRVPVQYNFSFPGNQNINGVFADTSFFKVDSLSR